MAGRWPYTRSPKWSVVTRSSGRGFVQRPRLPASTLTGARHCWFLPAMRKTRVSDGEEAAAGRDPLWLPRATSSRCARRPPKRGLQGSRHRPTPRWPCRSRCWRLAGSNREEASALICSSRGIATRRRPLPDRSRGSSLPAAGALVGFANALCHPPTLRRRKQSSTAFTCSGTTSGLKCPEPIVLAIISPRHSLTAPARSAFGVPASM